MVKLSTLQDIIAVIPTTRPFRVSEVVAKVQYCRRTVRGVVQLLYEWGYLRRTNPQRMGRGQWITTYHWNVPGIVSDWRFFSGKEGRETDDR